MAAAKGTRIALHALETLYALAAAAWMALPLAAAAGIPWLSGLPEGLGAPWAAALGARATELALPRRWPGPRPWCWR